MNQPDPGHDRGRQGGKVIDRLTAIATTIDRRIDAELEPYAGHHAMLMRIPGVGRLGAATIIAEAGVGMGVFGNAARLAARAGVCPASYGSAGKRRDGGARKGNVHLKTALVTAAVCAAKAKGSYHKDKHHRLRARRGAVRAAVAIARKILIAALHVPSERTGFRGLGEAFLDGRARRRVTHQLVWRLGNLGYDVTLRPRQEHPTPT